MIDKRRNTCRIEVKRIYCVTVSEVGPSSRRIMRLYYEKHLELFLKVYETQKNNLGDGSGLGSLHLAAERKIKST